VHVGGIAIYPNDLLHADCNGVMTIPQDLAAEIADVADEYIAAEMVIINAMRESRNDIKRLRAAQEESKNQREKLAVRVMRN
jgi:regulator of RNase E activity RraA